MLIVLFISCLSVFIVYLYSKGLLKNGLEIAFILLAAFFSIRYKYGNDYVGYMDVFNDISKYSSFSVLLSNYLLFSLILVIVHLHHLLLLLHILNRFSLIFV